MFYGNMKKTDNDEKESRYLVAETAFIALITYMASGLIFHELFEVETEAATFVVWSTIRNSENRKHQSNQYGDLAVWNPSFDVVSVSAIGTEMAICCAFFWRFFSTAGIVLFLAKNSRKTAMRFVRDGIANRQSLLGN